MSGGSWNYFYQEVQSVARRIGETGGTPETRIARQAFAKHLALVAEALHAIEWVDSCDYGPGDELAPIRACLAKGAELELATEAAKDALAALSGAIERAGRKGE